MGNMTNETSIYEDDSNSTSLRNSTEELMASLDKLTDLLKELNETNIGDDFSMLDLFNFGPPSISGMATSFTFVLLLGFIYYIPRMIYFRCTRFSRDVQKPGFIIIIFLSLLGITGAIIHLLAYNHDFQNSSLTLLLTGGKRHDNTNMIYQTFVRASNRIVSPAVLLLILQQFLMYNDTIISTTFQNNGIQLGLCVITSCAITLATYIVTLGSFEVSPKQEIYNPYDIDANVYDIVFPIFTAIMFVYVKSKIQKRIKYTAGEDQVSYMDRVNKVVVFQLVMSLTAIVAFILRDASSNSVIDSWFHFFVAAHTSVVHLILLRSLLRSKPPRRVCFLLLCSSVDQITSDQVVQPGNIEMVEKERAEDTHETIDHNKSIQIKMA